MISNKEIISMSMKKFLRKLSRKTSNDHNDRTLDSCIQGKVGLKEWAKVVGKLISNTDSGIKNPFENLAFRYKLTSQLASLIDKCDSKMFGNPDACIVIKDFEFAYLLLPTNASVKGAFVYLKEVEPYYEALKMAKEEGQNPNNPDIYMITDMFAKKALDIIQKSF